MLVFLAVIIFFLLFLSLVQTHSSRSWLMFIQIQCTSKYQYMLCFKTTQGIALLRSKYQGPLAASLYNNVKQGIKEDMYCTYYQGDAQWTK